MICVSPLLFCLSWACVFVFVCLFPQHASMDLLWRTDAHHNNQKEQHTSTHTHTHTQDGEPNEEEEKEIVLAGQLRAVT